MPAIAYFRCVTRDYFAVLLRSWIYEIPSLSDFSIIEFHILLCHNCDVVLLVEVLLVFSELDQCLVWRLVDQLEILQTSLGIAVFPDPVKC